MITVDIFLHCLRIMTIDEMISEREIADGTEEEEDDNR